MNAEKLKKLQQQVRIGGKGTPRRKKKIVHQTAATDDKKLQSTLKKLSVNTIPGIEEVNMIKDDGSVIHFNNPKAQASLAANTFAITGQGEHKQIGEMLPGILTQLGPEGLNHLKRLANNVAVGNKLLSSVAEEDDVPNLVENFEEVSQKEVEETSKKMEPKQIVATATTIKTTGTQDPDQHDHSAMPSNKQSVKINEACTSGSTPGDLKPTGKDVIKNVEHTKVGSQPSSAAPEQTCVAPIVVTKEMAVDNMAAKLIIAPVEREATVVDAGKSIPTQSTIASTTLTPVTPVISHVTAAPTVSHAISAAPIVTPAMATVPIVSPAMAVAPIVSSAIAPAPIVSSAIAAAPIVSSTMAAAPSPGLMSASVVEASKAVSIATVLVASPSAKPEPVTSSIALPTTATSIAAPAIASSTTLLGKAPYVASTDVVLSLAPAVLTSSLESAPVVAPKSTAPVDSSIPSVPVLASLAPPIVTSPPTVAPVIASTLIAPAHITATSISATTVAITETTTAIVDNKATPTNTPISFAQAAAGPAPVAPAQSTIISPISFAQIAASTPTEQFKQVAPVASTISANEQQSANVKPIALETALNDKTTSQPTEAKSTSIPQTAAVDSKGITSDIKNVEQPKEQLDVKNQKAKDPKKDNAPKIEAVKKSQATTTVKKQEQQSAKKQVTLKGDSPKPTTKEVKKSNEPKPTTGQKIDDVKKPTDGKREPTTPTKKPSNDQLAGGQPKKLLSDQSKLSQSFGPGSPETKITDDKAALNEDTNLTADVKPPGKIEKAPLKITPSPASVRQSKASPESSSPAHKLDTSKKPSTAQQQQADVAKKDDKKSTKTTDGKKSADSKPGTAAKKQQSEGKASQNKKPEGGGSGTVTTPTTSGNSKKSTESAKTNG